MPSHIFTQLGLWQESIATNIKAATAARDYAAKVKMEGPWSEELHALDYMSYAYLQQADDHHAREIRDRVLELRTFKPTRNAMAYPYNSIPARFALERRQWREATELVETWPGMFPVAVALTHFARGYGAARLGDLAGARRELAALEALQPTPADAADQHCGTPAASLEPVPRWLRVTAAGPRPTTPSSSRGPIRPVIGPRSSKRARSSSRTLRHAEARSPDRHVA